MSQNKFFGLENLLGNISSLSYTSVEMQKSNRKCIQIIFFDIREYFEISMFEVLRVD